MHHITVSRARLVLRTNAAFSVVSGLIAVAAAGWVSDVSGIDHVLLTRIGGVGLLLFAADVVRQSRLPESKLPFALLQTSIADASWVVATAIVLALVDLTGWGVAGAIVIAIAVADFGAAQLWLRAKLVRRPDPVTVVAAS
ncbi:MAG: hypothetical protein AAGA90_03865 [Actinomycetota bacterium]